MKNWFGEECHPTDEYIHWTQNPNEVSTPLRKAYDLIAGLGPEYTEALKLVAKAAYHAGELDEHDRHVDDE